MGAQDASQTFAHLRQWESTSIIVPLFSSWADLVNLHLKVLWILFLVPHGSHMGADADQDYQMSACIIQYYWYFVHWSNSVVALVFISWSEGLPVTFSSHQLDSLCRLTQMSQQFSYFQLTVNESLLLCLSSFAFSHLCGGSNSISTTQNS